MSGSDRGPGSLDRLGLTDDAKLFARMAAFGLVVGGGYGLLTGEPAGLVLLVAFGLASAVAAIGIAVGSRRRPTTGRPAGAMAPRPPDASGHADVATPGWAPIEIGIGLGGLALGAAFGPWLAIAGLLVALIGARGWLAAVNRVAEPPAAGGGPMGPAEGGGPTGPPGDGAT